MVTSTEKDTSTTTKPVFIVTGFGPFNGVENNPTTVLANRIVDFLRDFQPNTGDGTEVQLSHITRTMVIETSAQAVRKEISMLAENLPGPDTVQVILHLGVSGRKNFALESRAYNDASFRVPDELGYQPDKVAIVKDKGCPIGTELVSLLPVQALVDYMNGVFPRIESEEYCWCLTLPSHFTSLPMASYSTDPGRFVCNYVYCCTLDTFRCNQLCNGDTRVSVRSLFLHVPSFEVIPEETQLEFVAHLMHALYQVVVREGELGTQMDILSRPAFGLSASTEAKQA